MRSPFLHQRRQHRLVGGVTGDEQQRARIAEPRRQLLLQRLMRRAKAGDVAGTAAADAVALRALLPGGDHPRVLAQPQVVVAGEIQVETIAEPNLAAIAALGGLSPTVGGVEAPLCQRLLNALLPAHHSAAL